MALCTLTVVTLARARGEIATAQTVCSAGVTPPATERVPVRLPRHAPAVIVVGERRVGTMNLLQSFNLSIL